MRRGRFGRPAPWNCLACLKIQWRYLLRGLDDAKYSRLSDLDCLPLERLTGCPNGVEGSDDSVAWFLSRVEVRMENDKHICIIIRLLYINHPRKVRYNSLFKTSKAVYSEPFSTLPPPYF
jgi:hypothetical protein